MDEGGVFFDTSSEVYYRLRNAGIDPWEVNAAFLRQQAEAGRSFEYVLRGLEPRQFGPEVRAIRQVSLGDMEKAMKALGLDIRKHPIPARLQEAAWLVEQGYRPEVTEADQVIRWHAPEGAP